MRGSGKAHAFLLWAPPSPAQSPTGHAANRHTWPSILQGGVSPAQAAKPEPSTYEKNTSYEQELLVSGGGRGWAQPSGASVWLSVGWLQMQVRLPAWWLN